jgi:voltage-gated potassium channel
MSEDDATQHEIESERWSILRRLEAWLEKPMIVLAFIWLALFIVEVVWGLSPLLEGIGTFIWILFILDFAARFLIAPRKLAYLKTEWLTGVSLLVPALRAFRIVRVMRLARVASAGRGLRVLRVVSTFNRSMHALGKSMGRRGLGYVAGTTLIVLIAGGAAMYAFENNPGGKGLNSYGNALWWTAMLMTTIGSEFWPQTPAGKLLCLLISIFSLGVFGYLTAALATFFVGRDAEDDEAELVGTKQIAELKDEIRALREELHGHSERSEEG